MPSAATATSSPQLAPAQLSLAEHVCLALVIQGLSHGWALGTILAPGGELGRIWTLSRPLTYRAIDGLVDKGLVTRRSRTSDRGPDRLPLASTASGRRATARWLDTPVQHLRDVRTELLIKLALRARAGLDNTPLLAAQQDAFAGTIDHLTSTKPSEDLVDLWRRENARAVRRFLDHALQPTGQPSSAQVEMRLSARNQIQCTATAVHHGDVMSTINAVLGDGQALTAAITKDAAADLDVAPGDAILLIIKSTEVIVAKTS